MLFRIPFFFALFCSLLHSHTLPSPEQMQEIKSSGEWGDYLEHLKEHGHHKIDPELAEQAQKKIQEGRLKSLGYTDKAIQEKLTALEPENNTSEDGPNFVIPGGRNTMNTTGTVKTLVVVVEFDDYRLADPNNDGDLSDAITQASIQSNVFGSGTATANTNHANMDSLHDYYDRASHGNLNIDGDVFVHTFPLTRDNYEPAQPDVRNGPHSTDFYNLVIDPALDALDSTIDFTEYDSNGDGYVDSVNFIFCGPTGPWATYWWGVSFGVSGEQRDGMNLQAYTRQWLALRSTNDYNPSVLVHELGHKLGLPDLYDYDDSVGPDGGAASLDMMGGSGGVNAFFKWILDWQDPIIISSGTPQNVTINARGDTSLTGNKAYAIWPNIQNTSDDDLLREFYMVENLEPLGNDANVFPSREGLAIWHVNAEYGGSGQYGYLYDNSYTNYKLLRMVEADNDDRNDNTNDQGAAQLDDFYVTGHTFSPSSAPNSNSYAGDNTNIVIQNISAAGNIMTADIGFLNDGNTAPSAQITSTHNSVTARTPEVFTASGVDIDNDPLTYSWDFGDGSTMSGASVSHTFPSSGTYNVTVTVSDGVSLFGTATSSISVIVTDPLDSWNEYNVGVNSYFYGLHDLNGLLFAVGSNYIMVSADGGENWNQSHSVSGNTFEDAAYDNGTYIVVGGHSDSSYILKSTDANTWTEVNPNITGELDGIFVNNGTWIAVGKTSSDTSLILRSVDQGETWTTSTLNSGGLYPLLKVAYGNNTFVAVSNGNTSGASSDGEILYSTDDGMTWAPAASHTNTDNGNSDVMWDGSKFITARYFNPMESSPDGNNWTEGYYRFASMENLAIGDGLYVATGNNGTIKMNISPDGENWTDFLNYPSSIDSTWTQGAEYASGHFYLSTYGKVFRSGFITPQSGASTSPASLTIASSTTANVGETILFGGSAVDTDNTTLKYTWDMGEGTVYSGANFRHAYNTEGTFTVKMTVSDGLSGFHSTSTSITVTNPLNNWVQVANTGSSLYCMKSVGGSNIIAAGNGAIHYSTDNGTIWNTASAPPNFDRCQDIATDGTNYLIVGYNSSNTRGTVLHSTDLMTWTDVNLGASYGFFYGVDYLNGAWVVIGASGTILRSTDLTTWTQITSPTTNELRKINNNGAVMVAVGGYYEGNTNDKADILLSTDNGLTWSLSTFGTSERPFRDIAWTGNRFIGSRFYSNISYSALNDNSAWTEDTYHHVQMYGIGSGAGHSLAVGQDLMIHSGDETTWSNSLTLSSPISAESDFRDVTYHAGSFFVVANSGNIYKSDIVATGYDLWELQHSSLAGQTADDNNNGLSNLLEYALGFNNTTTSTDTNVLDLEISSSGTTSQITFQKPDNRDDIVYTIEASSTLKADSWSTTGISVINENSDCLEVMSENTLSPNQIEFYRLKVAPTE